MLGLGPCCLWGCAGLAAGLGAGLTPQLGAGSAPPSALGMLMLHLLLNGANPHVEKG